MQPRPNTFELLQMPITVPEGVSGDWKVSRFSVDKEAASGYNIGLLFSGSGRRAIAPGTYTRLSRKGTVVMSNTPAEIRDHFAPVEMASGNVLIAGLGLGVVLQACLEKPGVSHATVIEKSPDVIALVAEHYRERYKERLTIVEADIFEWKPPKDARYGMAWFDIWDDINADNLPEMARLHRRFTRRSDWYGSWSQRLCQYHNRRDRERYRYW